MTTFVDLFSGAGGLSLGLKNAGWKPVLSLDHWDDAIATYRHNFNDHPCINADVASVSEADFALYLSHCDWVVGGPPCQGFSTVGRRKRDDPRNRLVFEFARTVDILRPENFLIENVIGLKDMKFVGAVESYFAERGYKVSTMVLRSADYGVPQLRHRIFFVGSLAGASFDAPQASHGPGTYVTVEDAIGDLPVLGPGEAADRYDRPAKAGYQKRMRRGCSTLSGHEASKHPAHLVQAISHIPDGGNRRDIPASLQPKSGFHNSYSRLHSRSPAVAVTQNMGKPSGTRCIHPFQHRGLTAREGARLQGFPDAFEFLGGMTSQRLQVANAVSPILAEAIGRHLAKSSSDIQIAAK
ncbi:DNA cytosine methyltransferase [Brevundimonas naejangsanensis]|uniref:DNA cytosine methyltransferase n=1 Tax=Brevundimonas naejangsanensis TaxID=588932 RepID=UPI0026EAC29E|nr:DNA cytosine methyltransferase [Brevundimonas naejangsanensis]